MNIYVGNLSADVSEQDLREAFEGFGAVSKVSIIKDKFTGEPRGFAFVEMPDRDASQKAIDTLSGKELKGKSIAVNEARQREERGGSRGGGRGGSRFGGGGGGSSSSGGGRPRSQRY